MIEVVIIRITISSNFDLNLVLLILDLIATLILVVVVTKASRRREVNPTVNVVDQVKLLESRIVNNIDMFRKTIERVKDSNLNILSAIEIRLKELDRTTLSLSEKLDKKLSKIESALTNTVNVKIVNRLEDIDCVFRDDGLIVYGSYDKKFVVYITQALRVLEGANFEMLEISKDGSTVSIGVLGRVGGKTLYCLKESLYPVRFDSEKILKELGGIIGQ